jgi:hypothetical protein
LRFFQAIRDNDAKAALAELASTPTDTTFITNEVLAAGHSAGAITDISVPATNSTVVPVSYKLGGETVTDRISVQPVGNGYKVSTSLNSGRDRSEGQDPGAAAAQHRRHRGHDRQRRAAAGELPVDYGHRPRAVRHGSLVVKRLTDAPSANDLKLEVSDVGQAAAAPPSPRRSKACAAQKSFTPTGCPFKLTVTTADPSTVTWTLLSKPADDLKITISATDVARSTVEVPLLMRISYVDGGTAVPQDLATVQAVGTIDLLANPTTVTWTT